MILEHLPGVQMAPDREKPFNLTLKGLRIPFVALWNGEKPNITHCPSVGCDAVYTGKVDHRAEAEAGELGKVMLGFMAPQRQRYCMVHQICQICGLRMRYQFQLGQINERGPDKLLCWDEPPCCAACALVAIESCPFVKQHWADHGGVVVKQYTLALQQTVILKGDDRHRFNKSGAPLDRATHRRYLNKPVVCHVRMVPNLAAKIDGDHGRKMLEDVANGLVLW